VGPIKTTIFTTSLDESLESAYVYILDNENKTYNLYFNNDGVWELAEDDTSVIYTYSFRDKYGNATTYKG